MNTYRSDFLIIGGGIIGLSIARELKKRFQGAKIALLEKESECGLHASGRNSGIIHAGFYYSADSLKAKFTREGNRRLTEYCHERNLKINSCGKLVVTKNEQELPLLNDLYTRGQKNGVLLHMIDDKQAREIEPRIRTVQRALFSPTTSSVDPREVMLSIKQDAENDGVAIHLKTHYLKRTSRGVMTNKGLFQSSFVVGAAGLHADRVARDFGFSNHYRILPFKGLYLYSDESPGTLRAHVYPVPNPQFPFLGVHFTVTADGRSKIGPTAIPALWREQYRGMEGFQIQEFFELGLRQMELLLTSNFDFKRLAFEELRKYSRSRLVTLTTHMLEGVHLKDYRHWGKPGIRAQLIDLRKGKLEMDFVVEGNENSLHVLNAVSPAFTCAFPIADHVCDMVSKTLK